MGASRGKWFHLCVSTDCRGSLGDYLRLDTWLLQGEVDEVNSILAGNYWSLKPLCSLTSLNTDQGEYICQGGSHHNIAHLQVLNSWKVEADVKHSLQLQWKPVAFFCQQTSGARVIYPSQQHWKRLLNNFPWIDLTVLVAHRIVLSAFKAAALNPSRGLSKASASAKVPFQGHLTPGSTGTRQPCFPAMR